MVRQVYIVVSLKCSITVSRILFSLMPTNHTLSGHGDSSGIFISAGHLVQFKSGNIKWMDATWNNDNYKRADQNKEIYYSKSMLLNVPLCIKGEWGKFCLILCSFLIIPATPAIWAVTSHNRVVHVLVRLIIIDEILGYSGNAHLASLSISIQSIFLLPAIVKYNFLNQPMETLGDELYLNSSDAVLITSEGGIIINLNKAARNLFNLLVGSWINHLL